jgi:hypothetical protein
MPYLHIFFLVQTQCKTVSQPPETRLNFKYKSFPSFAPFTYMILQTTQHNTHLRTPMLQALFIIWAKVLVGKCLSAQMSFWANVFMGKCLSRQMSFWANVFLGKCLSGQISFWANVFWANVFLGKCLFGANDFWANVHLGKCLSGQMSSGQMSSGQMSFWANVFWANVFWANVGLGKCLWANVSGQTSYGQMSYHHSAQLPAARVMKSTNINESRERKRNLLWQPSWPPITRRERTDED